MPCALRRQAPCVASGCVFASQRILLAALIVGTACTTPPNPALPPTASLRVHYQTASAVSHGGPRSVTVALVAVPQPPAGMPLERAASAITSDRGAPFRATSALPSGCRWLEGAAASEWAKQPLGALPVLGDATGVVDASLAARFEVSAELPTLLCEPGPDGALLLRLLTNAAAPPRTELLFLSSPLPPAGTAVLFLPMAHATFAGRAMVVHNDGPATAAAAAEAHAEQPGPTAPPPTRDNWHLAQDSVGEHNLRPALLALARSAGTARGIDVLLSADEPALVAIGAELDAIAAGRSATASSANGADGLTAFAFESALWLGLLPRCERDELSPGLRVGVRRALGAVADDPTTLRQLVQTHGTAAQFAAALRDANLQALQDRDAGLRSVAHEWLLANASPVADYDPFADLQARRAALRKFHAADAAAADR